MQRLTDRLFLGYFVGLAFLLAVLAPDLASELLLLSAALVVVTVAWLGRRPRFAILHGFSPIAYVIAGFQLTAAAGAINPLRGDDYFVAGEQRWFAPVAAAWRGALGRPEWLTALSYLAYIAFYAVPVIIGLLLWRRDRHAFDRFVRLVCLGFVVTWLGYLVLPTAGPRLRLGEAAFVVGGGFIGRAARAFLELVERNHWDAFPSGHTSLSILYVAGAWTALPRWRAALMAWAAATIFATVYLPLHYLGDVLVGAAVAAALIVWNGWSKDPKPEVLPCCEFETS